MSKKRKAEKAAAERRDSENELAIQAPASKANHKHKHKHRHDRQTSDGGDDIEPSEHQSASRELSARKALKKAKKHSEKQAVTTILQSLPAAIVEDIIPEKASIQHGIQDSDTDKHTDKKRKKKRKNKKKQDLTDKELSESAMLDLAKVDANDDRDPDTGLVGSISVLAVDKTQHKQPKSQDAPKKSNSLPNKSKDRPSIEVAIEQLHREISLEDLRNLVIQILTGATFITYLTLHNPYLIRRVVSLTIPGISPDLFSVSVRPISSAKLWRETKSLDKIKVPEQLTFLKRMAPYMWLPKAAGDETRLHSPIGTFFNCPLTDAEKRLKALEVKDPSKKRVFLKDCLLELPDLLDNEYPIHSSMLEGDDTLVAAVQSQTGWVESPSAATNASEANSAMPPVFGLDCEMCETSSGREVTRVTMIAWDGTVAYDELVKPSNEIIDYLTQWSGMTESRLRNTTTTLSQVQAALMRMIDTNTILVGHSLNADLSSLQFAHPTIIDTSVLYQHSRGPPFKPSLKWLANKWLKKQIQQSITSIGPQAQAVQQIGHDSVEDATTCLELLKLKLKRGRYFGCYEVAHESLFSRLGNQQVRTAVVDYGNPAGWYGSVATMCTRCTTDDEVIEGVLHSAARDDGDCRFVWGRMREMESISGWYMRNNDTTTTTQPEDTPEAIQSAMASVEAGLTRLDTRLNKLLDGLPRDTLVQIYSGAGDPREMARLATKRRKYAELHRTKNWARIPEEDVFTDGDHQALQQSVEAAKTGVAFMGLL